MFRLIVVNIVLMADIKPQEEKTREDPVGSQSSLTLRSPDERANDLTLSSWTPKTRSNPGSEESIFEDKPCAGQKPHAPRT